MQILVVGMHRSGTSMLTRILNLMGAYAGAEGEMTDVGIGMENPKGFWERSDVRDANQRLLAAAGCDWENVSSWGERAIPAKAESDFAKAARTIALRLDTNRPWVIKDPRCCLTLDRWLAVLETPVVVLIIRHPLEVAVSLSSRNEFPLELGLALWEKYHVSALNALKSAPLLTVEHGRLVSSPMEESQRLKEGLEVLSVHGLRMPTPREIESFVDPTLHRAKLSGRTEGFLDHPSLTLYEKMASGDFDTASLSDESRAALKRHEQIRQKLLVRLRAELVAEGSNGPVASSSEGPAGSRHLRLVGNLNEARVGFELARRDLSSLFDQIREQGPAPFVTVEEAEACQAKLVAAQNEAKVLAQKVGERDQELAAASEELERSRSMLQQKLIERAAADARAETLAAEASVARMQLVEIRSEEARVRELVESEAAALRKHNLALKQDLLAAVDIGTGLASRYQSLGVDVAKVAPADASLGGGLRALLEANRNRVTSLEEVVRDCGEGVAQVIATTGQQFAILEQSVEAAALAKSSLRWKIGSLIVVTVERVLLRKTPRTALEFLAQRLADLRSLMNDQLGVISTLARGVAHQVPAALAREPGNGTTGVQARVQSGEVGTRGFGASAADCQLRVDGEISANRFASTSVDIVVCVHNAREDIHRLLQSLRPTLASRRRLILVNDGSELGTTLDLREFVRSCPHACLVEYPVGRGYTRAANHGLRMTDADFVVLLNSDTVVPQGWLEGLLECAFSAPEIGMVGPLSNAASWQSVPRCLGRDGKFLVNPLPVACSVDAMARVVRESSERRYPQVGLLNGFCLGIKRAVLDKVGLLDEASFPRGYGEENDYCLRAVREGFQLAVADDVYVFHRKSMSYGNELREALSQESSAKLRSKHGEAAVSEALGQTKGSVALDELRERIRRKLGTRQLPNFILEQDLKVLFVLPVKGGGGGSHSVVQEAQAMFRMGVQVTVAVTKSSSEHFERTYSDIEGLNGFVAYFRDDEELRHLAAECNVVIATVFHSAARVARIIEGREDVCPIYYVQDYEPWFFEPGTDLHAQALHSYEAIPGAIGMAKTDWLCREVAGRHALPMRKVTPSIDHTVYFPAAREAGSQPLRIAAMIRPSTPRRAPERTLRVASMIKSQLGDQVEFRFFGVDRSHEIWTELGAGFVNECKGELSRPAVAALLRDVDLFMDLSDYQAFGRTGLEAMASGCIAVVPDAGGAHEYAIDGENSIVVDTVGSSEETIAGRIVEVLTDRAWRERIIKAALATAQRYTAERAALSELSLFAKALRSRKQDLAAGAEPFGRVAGETALNPVRIGLICTRLGSGAPTGSAYIRMILPFEEITRRSGWKVDLLSHTGDASLYDIVVVQRTAVTTTTDLNALRASRESGTKVFVDVDDRLWSMDAHHLEGKRYADQLAPLLALVAEADGVLVSTPEIAEDLGRLNPNVKVVPNAIDAALWGTEKATRSAPADGPLRLVAMGTNTHTSDLETILPALDAVWSRHPGQFQLDLVGMSKADFGRPWINVLDVPDCEYPAYVRWIQDTNDWHAALVPLARTPFNEAKSHIKILDAWALGLPVVASSVPAYRKLVDEGVNGFVVESTLDWEARIEALVNDRSALESMGRKGRQQVLDRYALGGTWTSLQRPLAHAIGLYV